MAVSAVGYKDIQDIYMADFIGQGGEELRNPKKSSRGPLLSGLHLPTPLGHAGCQGWGE